MAKVAQLVRVSVCGTECREFESHLSPQIKTVLVAVFLFLLGDFIYFRICFSTNRIYNPNKILWSEKLV